MRSHLLIITALCMSTFISCTKDTEDSASISESTLSSMASSDDLILSRSTKDDNGSWNIKMNDVASKAYAEGKDYPLNSMIVKEKRDSRGELVSYAVMYHSLVDPHSVDGWVWSEFDNKGEVIYSESEMGVSCKSCHATHAESLH